MLDQFQKHFNSNETLYNDIHGWFTFPQLYSQVVSRFPDGSHFVEIGVWKGKSDDFFGANGLALAEQEGCWVVTLPG